MRLNLRQLASTAAIGVALSSAASAAEILVTSDIATSTTWTSDNTYNMQDQIYVLPGATLTIEAGTVVASDTGIGGSLAVTKGAQIMVLGTQSNPVIMTSKADVATWVGGDPKTGTWREAVNEFGNLAIMGGAYISENATAGNTAVPSASNVAALEGLTADFPGDTKVLYGGGDDDDDSGSIHYLSIRYGGKVIGLGNELNGLSLGGIGRGTDIDHVEIMNNVDDGTEIWGGTVNLKYITIWNVGDDSFDIDQGWRGKAQFGLIVQGYSVDASQGSGVGDNCFETDGAEDSDWQPVTTASIYNFTAIGQPLDGDQGTAWRDNARVQYHNCVWTDIGDQFVKFDNVDGDGANGYGFNGTLSWADTWTTDYTEFSTVNAPANPANFYKSQVSGKLAEITDSVVFNAGDLTEAIARGVFDGTHDNVQAILSPIQSVVRAAPVVKGGKVMQQVISLDPRAANDAVTSVGVAPTDGFFTPAQYRGAFDAENNWLCGWTAADAFGFLVRPAASTTLRNGGSNPASYIATSNPVLGSTYDSTVDLGSTGHSIAILVGYASSLTLPLSGNTLLVNVTDAGGELLGGPSAASVGGTASFSLPVPNDGALCGMKVFTQAIHFGGAPFVLSNAQDLVLGD